MAALVTWFMQGGYLLVLLCLLATVALAFALERGIALGRVARDLEGLPERVRRALAAQRVLEAHALCEALPGPVAAVLRAGLELAGQPRDELRDALSRAAARAGLALRRSLPVISAVAHGAPLVGVLGTVLELMHGAKALAGGGTATVGLLLGSLGGALLPTALGLAIGIPALFAHHALAARASRLAAELELAAAELADALARPARARRRAED